MCIAVAIIGAAAIGAVGSAVAGSEAASATKDATNASINAQNQAQQRQQALNAPYAAIGTGGSGTTGAIQQYQNLLGLGSGGTADMEKTLAATPGYQFARDQGLQSTLNAATLSNPGGVSGNTLEALDKFSTGLADQTYQQAVTNAQNAVTIGQNAAAGTGAGILQTGANVGSTLSQAGATQAGIAANQVAGISNAASSALGNYATLNTLQNLNAGSIDAGWGSGAYGNSALTSAIGP